MNAGIPNVGGIIIRRKYVLFVSPTGVVRSVVGFMFRGQSCKELIDLRR